MLGLRNVTASATKQQTDSIAHQAADVESVRTAVLVRPEHNGEHNGKHGEEHAKLDMELRCRGTKKEEQQLEGNQRG